MLPGRYALDQQAQLHGIEYSSHVQTAAFNGLESGPLDQKEFLQKEFNRKTFVEP